MRIAVIGAGAMGCLFGGLLARSGEEVWLYDVWAEHVKALNENGLTLIDNEGEHRIPVRATTDVRQIGVVDLVIVFVKSTHTAQAMEAVQACTGPDSLVLTLQNGLGNIETITARIPAERVLAGVTSQGSTLLGPGKIRHAGGAKTYIGPVTTTRPPGLEKVIKAFNEAGIDTALSDNAVGMIWTKLLANVGINALTAITGLPNGDLLKYPELMEIMDGAIAEAVAVAEAKGIKLEVEDAREHVRAVCRATAANRSSMLQDVLNKRQTEIDAINGAIVREAEKLNLSVPYNRILTNLVKVIQQNY